MNRKGFLLASTVVKIVIAVICLVFLVYLLSSIYFNKVNAQRKAEAENTLFGDNKIGPEIERIHNGGKVNPDGISLFVPKGWSLFSFTGQEVKPNACNGVNCLCICDDVWFGYPWKGERERQAEECDESGACFASQYLVDYSKEIEILVGPSKAVMVNKFQGVRGDVKVSEK